VYSLLGKTNETANDAAGTVLLTDDDPSRGTAGGSESSEGEAPGRE
jgi:hypothetical protein